MLSGPEGRPGVQRRASLRTAITSGAARAERNDPLGSPLVPSRELRHEANNGGGWTSAASVGQTMGTSKTNETAKAQSLSSGTDVATAAPTRPLACICSSRALISSKSLQWPCASCSHHSPAPSWAHCASGKPRLPAELKNTCVRSQYSLCISLPTGRTRARVMRRCDRTRDPASSVSMMCVVPFRARGC